MTMKKRSVAGQGARKNDLSEALLFRSAARESADEVEVIHALPCGNLTTCYGTHNCF